jgi:hypothetical protein
MSYKELLTKVSDPLAESHNGFNHALRAIVELHKPDGNSNCAYCNKRFACKKCGSRLESYISYPCPTIQAIEKELA